jgi:tRNA 2-thiouridine synthesizing protein E
MMNASTDTSRPTRERQANAEFPFAPRNWTRGEAEKVAKAEGITLSEEHWEAVRALQSYFAKHDDDRTINMRELHDALDEHFHSSGGIKRLYLLFPGGPIAQGCRIAGLKAPFLATDTSFGSVA